MSDKPTSDQQSNGEEDGHDGQPVPSSPPESEKEADTQGNTSDFAGNDVKPRKDEQRSDHGRSQIPSRQSDRADPALHVGHSTLVRIKRDGFDFPAGTAGCNRMAKFMECDHQHLSRQR